MSGIDLRKSLTAVGGGADGVFALEETLKGGSCVELVVCDENCLFVTHRSTSAVNGLFKFDLELLNIFLSGLTADEIFKSQSAGLVDVPIRSGA